MTNEGAMAERRVQRSGDPWEALELFLSSLGRRLRSEAVVLSTRDGVLVSGVGDGYDLEQLGALAPCGERGEELDLRFAGGELRSHRIEVGGASLYLASVGGEPVPLRECVAALRRIQAMAA
ncbi:MAG: hypothetical protein MUF64_19160 [Polyangiaceae bacterium]|jgi:hypothetical protein|nr:hypothetical protein [Polyangiaceae bacterium]